MQLAGNTALNTGSARAIGRGFAPTRSRGGADIAGADINIFRVSKPAAEIGQNTAEIGTTRSAAMNLINPDINMPAMAPRPIKRHVGSGVRCRLMGVLDGVTGMVAFLACAAARLPVAQNYKVETGQWMS